jgi:hypothetical protein
MNRRVPGIGAISVTGPTPDPTTSECGTESPGTSQTTVESDAAVRGVPRVERPGVVAAAARTTGTQDGQDDR